MKIKNLHAFYISNFKKNFQEKFANQAGFSLLEMSIVLIIIGTLASFMMPVLLKQSVLAKRIQTRQYQQDIFYSLAAYLLAGNPLPCPADPAATGAQSGIAREGGCSHPTQAVGILPYRTLGIPESAARDGYGHYFTYAVAPNLTVEPDDFKGGKFDDKFRDSYCKILIKEQALQVRNGLGHSVLGERLKAFAELDSDFIAVVLVSHGEGGHGAFRGNGSNERFRVQDFGSAEDQNAQSDLIFVDQPYSSNPMNLFRHMTAWVTHKNLVAVYAHTPCKIDPQRRVISSSSVLQPDVTPLDEQEIDLDEGF